MRPSTILKSLLFVLPLSTHVVANNIQVTNVDLVQVDASNADVTFNINWENSWRLSATSGWDAAWVFVKFRTAGGAWQHANLSNAGHIAPSGSQIDPGLLSPDLAYNPTSNPVVGVFIRRSALGSGTFSANNVHLRWNLSNQGIAYGTIAEFEVLAIEMVYVAQGAFYLGSGGSEGSTPFSGSYTDGVWTSGNTTPFLITSEGPVLINHTMGNLWSTNFNTFYNNISIPGTMPKGYRAFYCMKYEVTQQEYVDFLNTLSRTQQAQRVASSIAPSVTAVSNRYVMSNSATVQYRNGIRCDSTVTANVPVVFYCDLNGNGTGGEANDGQWLPANYLSMADLLAFLDWSGLRPMTEFEFEKACRGTMAPVPNEYPWGTATLASGTTTVDNAGTANELPANYSPTSGNVESAHFIGRVGMYAAHPGNTGRVSAGATVYGILDMGGNVAEGMIQVANTFSFQGTLGNGALNANGFNDNADWNNSSLTARGQQGGTATSSRQSGGTVLLDRGLSRGGRGVRQQ